MAAKIHLIERLCCGSTAYVVDLEKSIKKKHKAAFENLGYLISNDYADLGMFYAQKEKLIATCSFDRTSVSIRCNGPTCEDLIKIFADAADQIVTKDT